MRSKVKIFLTMLVAGVAGITTMARAEWRKLQGPALRDVLQDALLINETESFMGWRIWPDGTFGIVHEQEDLVPGRWRIEQDRFCHILSSANEECYGVEIDDARLRLSRGQDQSLWQLMLSPALDWRRLSDQDIRHMFVGYSWQTTEPGVFLSININTDETEVSYEDGIAQTRNDWVIENGQYCTVIVAADDSRYHSCAEVWLKGDQVRLLRTQGGLLTELKRSQKLDE